MDRKFVTILSIFLLCQSLSGHPTFNKNEEELLDEDLLDAYLDIKSDENLNVLKADNLDGLQLENDDYLSKSYDNDEYNEYNEHSFDDHIENKIHNIQKRESNETSSDTINEEIQEETENKEVEIPQDELQENVQETNKPEETTINDENPEEGSEPEATVTEENGNNEETGNEENVNEEETGNEEAPQEANVNEQETGNEEAPQEENVNKEESGNEEAPQEENVNKEESGNEEAPQEENVNKEETENEETPQEENVNKEESGNEEAPQEENVNNEETGEKVNQDEETHPEETVNEETHNEENPKEDSEEPLPSNSPARSALNTHEDLTQDTEEIKVLYLPETITPGSYTPQTRIVGGIRVTNREDFAYQASFRLITGQHFCGATIIDDKNLLTAAHCVYDDNQRLLNAARLIIAVGDLNVLDPNQYTVIRPVQHIIPHPQYNYKTFQNDIAVLRVESLGEFTNYINSVELAQTTPSAGTTCVVSGWGKTSYNGVASPELRKVNVPIVSQKDCEIGYPYGILDGMICAGLMEGGKDACQGDSGGPLVCDNKLAGVVSWGKDCALKNHPGVYTDVASFYSWIRIQQGFDDKIEGEITPEVRSTGLVAQKREEFPYQASLRYKQPNSHFCGATIIDANHLLTSAHCVINDTYVMDPDSLWVVVGDINILEETDVTEYRDVSSIFTHPNYNQNTFENDIAVIRVSAPFEQWTQDIKPIDLAENSPEAYSSCLVSGWGSATNKYNPSEVLRYASIPIIENRTCTNKYTDGIKPGMFCAGFMDKGKDTCQGDGGGPLVCDNKLSGIVSWGFRCANEGLPGVYTDVAMYRSWVDEQKSRSSSSLLKNSTFVLVICFSILKIFNAA